MAEKTAPTPTEQFREQYQAVENAFAHGSRAVNELTMATTEMTFDLFQKGFQYNQQFVQQFERGLQDTLATYRTLYQDGLKSWQGYVQSVNDIVTRNVETFKG